MENNTWWSPSKNYLNTCWSPSNYLNTISRNSSSHLIHLSRYHLITCYQEQKNHIYWVLSSYTAIVYFPAGCLCDNKYIYALVPSTTRVFLPGPAVIPIGTRSYPLLTLGPGIWCTLQSWLRYSTCSHSLLHWHSIELASPETAYTLGRMQF